MRNPEKLWGVWVGLLLFVRGSPREKSKKGKKASKKAAPVPSQVTLNLNRKQGRVMAN